MNALEGKPNPQDIMVAEAERRRQINKIGMDVWREDDDGHMIPTKTRSLPWQLGHGRWVVAVEGIAGGYDLLRITPRPLKPTAKPA